MKRYISIFGMVLLVSLLVVGLIGCGQPAADDGSGDDAGDDAAPEVDVVKIGFIGPITGPNAYQGVGARNAFEMAIAMANESGDYPYAIETIVLDDASEPATGAAAAQRIVDDPAVVAAIGHWNSPVADATIPVFKQAELPFIIWGAISPALTSPENYPYISRVALTNHQQNVGLVRFLVEEMGYTRFAIVSDTTSYGVTNTESFSALLEQYPEVELLEVHEIQVGETDFRPVLTSIQALEPEVIKFGGVVTEGGLVRRQMAELGMQDILMVGISGIADEKLIEIAGNEAIEGVVTAKPGTSIEKMSGGEEFVAEYEARGFAEPFGVYGPYAYDAVGIILQALKDVGPDPAALIPAINSISYDGLLGLTTFDEIGQTENILVSIQVAQDGQFVDWADSEYAAGTRTLPGK
jgi:branched-chain amino acid transport system substrate-binding protein